MATRDLVPSLLFRQLETLPVVCLLYLLLSAHMFARFSYPPFVRLCFWGAAFLENLHPTAMPLHSFTAAFFIFYHMGILYDQLLGWAQSRGAQEVLLQNLYRTGITNG